MNKEEIIKYKETKKYIDELREQYKIKQQEFVNQNKELIDLIESSNSNLEEIKEKIKEEALNEFKETSNKKLLGGIGIRVTHKVIYDSKDAFNWAKEHSICLALDKRAFDKIAKTQDLEFVKKEDKPIVTFPAKIELNKED